MEPFLTKRGLIKLQGKEIGSAAALGGSRMSACMEVISSSNLLLSLSLSAY